MPFVGEVSCLTEDYDAYTAILIYIYNTKNIKSPEKPICLYITKPVTAFLYSLGAEHDCGK